MALRDYLTPTLRVRGESLRHRLTAAPPLFEESRSCKTTERLNTDNATVIFKLLSPQKGFKDVGEKKYVAYSVGYYVLVTFLYVTLYTHFL